MGNYPEEENSPAGVRLKNQPSDLASIKFVLRSQFLGRPHEPVGVLDIDGQRSSALWA